MFQNITSKNFILYPGITLSLVTKLSGGIMRNLRHPLKVILITSVAAWLAACGGSGSGSGDGDDDSEPTMYAIGDTGPAGGKVFYITDGGSHGLEAAPVDQVGPLIPGAEWGCVGAFIIGADGTVIGTGAQNTADILVGCTDTPIAADIAAGYSLNGFSDWFLPSKDELNELYLNKDVVGGLSNFGNYWSSSQLDARFSWGQLFSNGNQGGYNKDGLPGVGVRAVRAF
jgi:hypothetical protein